MESAVRVVWRALDRAARHDVDAAVSAGRAVSRPELATVGVWRALRRRREWLLAALLGLACTAGAGLVAPAAGVAAGLALLVPAERLWRLHRALDANVLLARSAPQLTAVRARPHRSELDRRLSGRG